MPPRELLPCCTWRTIRIPCSYPSFITNVLLVGLPRGTYASNSVNVCHPLDVNSDHDPSRKDRDEITPSFFDGGITPPILVRVQGKQCRVFVFITRRAVVGGAKVSQETVERKKRLDARTYNTSVHRHTKRIACVRKYLQRKTLKDSTFGLAIKLFPRMHVQHDERSIS